MGLQGSVKAEDRSLLYLEGPDDHVLLNELALESRLGLELTSYTALRDIFLSRERAKSM